jgi:hypothetical protein
MVFTRKQGEMAAGRGSLSYGMMISYDGAGRATSVAHAKHQSGGNVEQCNTESAIAFQCGSHGRGKWGA